MKKQVDECYRYLDLPKRIPALREKRDLKMRGYLARGKKGILKEGSTSEILVT